MVYIWGLLWTVLLCTFLLISPGEAMQKFLEYIFGADLLGQSICICLGSVGNAKLFSKVPSTVSSGVSLALVLLKAWCCLRFSFHLPVGYEMVPPDFSFISLVTNVVAHLFMFIAIYGSCWMKCLFLPLAYLSQCHLINGFLFSHWSVMPAYS